MPDDLRTVRITRAFTHSAPGSVLIAFGETRVLCTAGLAEGVPKWLEGEGRGWCTAEYDMLPGATWPRRQRNRQRVDGRTHEIQRLIGRSLRAVLDLTALGENSLLVDCDVLQADGGTRTASVTGAYVAAVDALKAACREGRLSGPGFTDSVAAVSLGLKGRAVLLDLDYLEDTAVDVDVNVVMTGSGRLVEVQGTGERGTFTEADLARILAAARRGIKRLNALQQEALRRRATGGRGRS